MLTTALSLHRLNYHICLIITFSKIGMMRLIKAVICCLFFNSIQPTTWNLYFLDLYSTCLDQIHFKNLFSNYNRNWWDSGKKMFNADTFLGPREVLATNTNAISSPPLVQIFVHFWCHNIWPMKSLTELAKWPVVVEGNFEVVLPLKVLSIGCRVWVKVQLQVGRTELFSLIFYYREKLP